MICRSSYLDFVDQVVDSSLVDVSTQGAVKYENYFNQNYSAINFRMNLTNCIYILRYYVVACTELFVASTISILMFC